MKSCGWHGLDGTAADSSLSHESDAAISDSSRVHSNWISRHGKWGACRLSLTKERRNVSTSWSWVNKFAVLRQLGARSCKRHRRDDGAFFDCFRPYGSRVLSACPTAAAEP
jgi:hypothetical protein